MRTRRRRGAADAPFALITRPAIFNLLGGLLIGIVLGLVYTWAIAVGPVKNTTPDTLRARHKDDYVIMIAQAYAVEGDLDLARTRLATLQLANPGQHVADLAAAEIQRGAPLDDLRALSALAVALGTTPPPLP